MQGAQNPFLHVEKAFHPETHSRGTKKNNSLNQEDYYSCSCGFLWTNEAVTNFMNQLHALSHFNSTFPITCDVMSEMNQFPFRLKQ